MPRIPLIKSLAGASAALVVLIGTSLGENASDQVIDSWLTEERDGVVEIKPCGRFVCGYIQAILNTYGQKPPLVDVLNENPALRSRRICELPVLGKLRKLAADTWGEGWVYDPKRGKTFDVELTLRGQNELSVRGYYGVKMLGQTVIWTRLGTTPPTCR